MLQQASISSHILVLVYAYFLCNGAVHDVVLD